ncbi:hypothetical protein FRC01_008916, partial [Tulasnella sp. 417]
MEKYATWVQRSKDVQLNISINDQPFAEFAVENVGAIMELIGPQAERWRSLQLDQVPFENICIFLDRVKERSLPLLERLCVVESSNGFRLSGEPYCPSLGRVAFDAPRLKELELVGIVADFDCPLFHNLHSLNITDFYFSKLGLPVAKDTIHQLLRQSPHLKQLHFRYPLSLAMLPYQRARTPPPVNEDTLTHSSLLDLTLAFRAGVQDVILPFTRFPALRSFHLPRQSQITLDSWHLPLLVRNSPFPSLKRVTLCGNLSDHQYDRFLVDALSTLASLEGLGLAKFDMTQVADALPTLGHACPRLRSLSLHRCVRVDLQQVRSLVSTRRQADGVTRLRQLYIYNGMDDTLEVLNATGAWLKARVEKVILFGDGKYVRL